MQFNADSGNMDLCSLADDLLGGTDDTDFPLRQKALYANWGLREIFKAIYSVYGGWTSQDSNVSGVDEVATNLLNDGTQFYAFATVAIIAGVEYEDANGTRHTLTPITLEEIRELGFADDEFMKTAGIPTYYRPLKNGIKIYPSSSEAVTSGLIVKIGAQDISPFTAASTTAEPGYDKLAGHEAVSIFMAMKKAQIDTLDSFVGLLNSWSTAIDGIKQHYRKKFNEQKSTIRKSTRGGSFADQFV